MRIQLLAVAAAVTLATGLHAVAQTFVEIRQSATHYNHQSVRGVPLSNTVGVPPGSDGRAPSASSGSIGTAGQYQSVMPFGGVTVPNAAGLAPGQSLVANAQNLNLPRGTAGGQIRAILVSSRVGPNIVGRLDSLEFGALIPVPDTDEYGVPLSQVNSSTGRGVVAPETYWLAEPHSTNNHASDAGYYWSPHLERVFAVGAGPVDVPWIKALPSVPVGTVPGVGVVTRFGVQYTVLTKRYVVSGSPVKTPRKIYWTQGDYTKTGWPVQVPKARVSDIKIVFNNQVPERVANPVVPATVVEPNPTNRLDEARTLWFDQTVGSIQAYNAEGRVFMELLGNLKAKGGTARQHLGFEIVDLIREPSPEAVTTELGDRIPSYPDGRADDDLWPEALQDAGQSFAYRHSLGTSDRVRFYATRETQNLNDLQMHWLEEGIAGLRWPFRFVRYSLVWPTSVARYSHYVRPFVATEAEAMATAVQLPTDNAPILQYQDPLDRVRGRFTDKFAYYSFLSPEQPVHRALIRFTAGEGVRFERIFSWLDARLDTGNFAGTAVDGLDAWNGTGKPFDQLNGRVVARTYAATVNVGDRIVAPPGEDGTGFDQDYLAGHIVKSDFNLYHPGAYRDPLTDGFDAAKAGAIIPVNAVPGRNRLDVLWFRPNAVSDQDRQSGFKTIHWPAVIARYTLQWPSSPAEIVLASNDGSGALPSLQARGSIYVQNVPSLPGYNPNEEHALMQGGQAYALRDDLNIVSGSTYSSEPYVLVDYTETDGRPAMRVFKVLREKPSEGKVFDYAVKAGTVLQPPMPLPLLEVPFAPLIAGVPPVTLNRELTAWTLTGSAKDGNGRWSLTTSESHSFSLRHPLSLYQGSATPALFLPVSTSGASITGYVAASQSYPVAVSETLSDRWRLTTADASGLVPGQIAFLYHPATRHFWSAEISAVGSPAGTVEILIASIPAGERVEAVGSTILHRPETGGSNGQYDNWQVSWNVPPASIGAPALRQRYASFTLKDRKGSVWVYRGPHDGTENPVMSMKYYYRTLPGFYFPSLATNQQPPVGTTTPYLRARNADGYQGDAAFGNPNQVQTDAGNALAIVYRPVWPENVPVLDMAETLTSAKRGLPGVRGQTSLEVFYQQSQVTGGETNVSAILHDPTRERQYALRESGLNAIPGSVATTSYRGKIYFPLLPPHLVDRFFFDASRGALGALVLKGQFVEPGLGENYLLLNVVTASDASYLKNLCPSTDSANRSKWDAAIDGLATSIERFVENPARPGTYIPNPSESRTLPPSAVAEVRDDDEAVDSYALSSVGPGVGYVTLVAGNGRAFTPVGDPVSVQILRVARSLYRGEVGIVESSNPLNERLTLQQIADLAGQAGGFAFEWMIAAPVDGLPPRVYENEARTLMSDGPWSHVAFPVLADSAAAVGSTPASRVVQDVTTSVASVNVVPFTAVAFDGTRYHFDVASVHRLIAGVRVVIRTRDGGDLAGTVVNQSAGKLVVEPEPNQALSPSASEIVQLHERADVAGRTSLVYRTFDAPGDRNYTELWLSLDLDAAVGAKVTLDGAVVVRANLGDDDSVPGTPTPGLTPLPQSYRLPVSALSGGVSKTDGSRTHTVAVELFAEAFPDSVQRFNLRLEAMESVDVTASRWLPLDPIRFPDGVRAVLGGAADVRSLSDNYVIMRYQPRRSNHASWMSSPSDAAVNVAWSQWTSPQLAEGWIKRVLKGINPFNQRVADLFGNQVDTTVSILAQAGRRWEGDVALNLESLKGAGLIEIYDTVLNRGKMLSIGGGINYGPANDALLLAAGYLNDLYMILGNEAAADAADPTIAVGSNETQVAGVTDVATALYSFKGQLPSLLEEELAMLRGRDDFLLPGVETAPVYNRLVWNYTRGIDAGEVVYALNYNITDQDRNGVLDAADARRLYPQGHGDAYGHYLTALKHYYGLMFDPNFDWVPRIEAVTVLGKPVSVDYQDERKLSAAAVAVARTGKQIFDLTWRRDYKSDAGAGWRHLGETRVNSSTRPVTTTRAWGADHWAARTGQGAYLNWIIGNAIIPDVDPDPTHAGSIQQVDRSTVPELKELPLVVESLQRSMDNAEGRMNPLGLSVGTVPFDLNPLSVFNGDGTSHFEQIYDRAAQALSNASVAFEDATDLSYLMRLAEESLDGLKAEVTEQELAYKHTLIELYGTAYSDDVGPGKTYDSGYDGPDLIHYMYVDERELRFGGLLDPRADATFRIDIQTFRPDWLKSANVVTIDGKPSSAAAEDRISDFSFIVKARTWPVDGTAPSAGYLSDANRYVTYNLNSHGFFQKPRTWTGRRSSPGRLQQSISDIVKARNTAYEAFREANLAKHDLDWAILSMERKIQSRSYIREVDETMREVETALGAVRLVVDITDKIMDATSEQISDISETVEKSMPLMFVAGLAVGGDLTSGARGVIKSAGVTFKSAVEWKKVATGSVLAALEYANDVQKRFLELKIQDEQWEQEMRDLTSDVRDKVYGIQNTFSAINAALQELDDAQRQYLSDVAEGERIQAEREVFRQRTAALVHGMRTRDAAFRIFRNEKLERYRTLFDLAARYVFLAAQAYDYETGLLGTTQGKEFLSRIVRARALGVISDGEPQFAGSNTGDPGLSGIMAELASDYAVVSNRLGLKNPDAYGTTVSLRTENFRILPGESNDSKWADVLQAGRKANLLEDPDIRKHCMQIDPGNGLPVPGIVIEFSTTIADGLNLFGKTLAPGDHNFSPASFATKIFHVGVALEGYKGMDDPNANGTAIGEAGAASPADPSLAFLDPEALAATPYIYLIPAGVDSMRSPPLGDVSQIRTWNVDDAAIPLPFNVGGNEFSQAKLWQSSQSLSEPLFTVRKHQPFRPVSSANVFGTLLIYWTSGEGERTQYANTRLLGRSVWNSKWKLVIPGRNLLNDPDEGLDRLIRTVKDVKLFYSTYSYSGN